MSTENTTAKSADALPLRPGNPPRPGNVVSSVIHRICIQCNNVFRVPPDKFDAKQCPNCHKG